MHATWFALLGLMLTAYAVLDGFDFGAGIVHLFVAKKDHERRSILAAIGPLWDGNEVWLVASGGVFVFAFPRAYAAAFSGLYLPLMIVLWLLILRGLAIEFRSAVDNPLWHAAQDAVFAGASALMALILGVAIGNVIRGVPLTKDGYFHEDLFSFGSEHVGAIDFFTTICGLFAFATLGAHGGTFVAWKTSGPVGVRSLIAARRLWIATLVLGAFATLLTAITQPAFFARVGYRPLLWPLPLSGVAAALGAYRFLGLQRPLGAFLCSSAFIVFLLLATAGGLYPIILRSTVNEAFTLDAHNAASPSAGLAIGLALCLPAVALAAVYFVYLFRAFRGKSDVPERAEEIDVKQTSRAH